MRQSRDSIESESLYTEIRGRERERVYRERVAIESLYKDSLYRERERESLV